MNQCQTPFAVSKRHSVQNMVLLTAVIISLGLLSRWWQSFSVMGLEHETSLSGWLTIVWGDGGPGANESRVVYTLTDGDGRSINLSPHSIPFDELLAANNQYVTVVGEWAGADTFGLDAIQLEGKDVNALAAPQITGSQPWVSLMCKFSDISGESKSLSYFQDMYGSAYPGLDHYWHEQSYDLINVNGSVARGWYTLPHERCYYVSDTDGDGQCDDSVNLTALANDCTAVADSDVYFPNFVGINLMFNDLLDCCAWGGSRYMTLDGKPDIWRVTWEPPWGWGNIGVIEHEMGHGFGLPHSSGQYGQTYDNVWDVMSAHWTYCYLTEHPVYNCLGQHTISYHKDRLGWIPASEKYEAATNTTATITLERLAQPQTVNYKMATIPISGSNVYYTVEARRYAGYDNMLPGEAVIIHEVDTGRSRPAQVIDTDGNGDTGDAGAMWTVGETFTDAVHDIVVTIDSATATGFVVTIDTRSVVLDEQAYLPIILK